MLLEAERNLRHLAEDQDSATRVHKQSLSEVVADKGYHSNDVLVDLRGSTIRSYISEPDRGRRNRKGKRAEKNAVYANRRRITGNRGQALLKARAEQV
jgi:transposase